MANRLASTFNADLPPPIVAFTSEKQEEVAARVRLLTRMAEEVLAGHYAAIKKHDEYRYSGEAPADGTGYQKTQQDAILKRYAYTSDLRAVLLPLREISNRGTKYGLAPSLVDEVDEWCAKILAERYKDINAWAWEFGLSYLQLRHTAATALGEFVRLVNLKESLVQRYSDKKIRVDYDKAFGQFMDGIDVDVSQFPTRYQEALEQYKLYIWRDLLTWHLQLGSAKMAKKGVRLFEDMQSRADENDKLSLTSSDKRAASIMGSIYIVAARLYKSLGDTTSYNGLLADVQDPKNKNPYAPNAKKWMTQAGDGDTGSWESQPRPLEPARALTVARAFITEATRAVDPKLREKFYTDAAATLRDGIRGLPGERDPDFIELAPDLYRLYGYALNQRGWLYRAAIVSLEGLARFRPSEWEKGMHPDWSNRRGDKLTKAGDTILTLADRGLMYAQKLTSRAGGAVAKSALDLAIDYMRVYDPENVKDTVEFLQVIIMMQEGEFRQARELAERIGKAQMKAGNQLSALKALRYAVDAQYRYWQELIKEEIPNETALAEAEKDLDGLLTVLGKFCNPERLSQNPPDDIAAELRRGWQMVSTVQIGRRFKAGEYRQVIDELDPAFWEGVPRDQELVRRLLVYLCGSAYKLAAETSTTMKEQLATARQSQDRTEGIVALIQKIMPTILADWPRYDRALQAYQQQSSRFPGLEAETENLRKQLSQVFNLTTRQLEFVQANLLGLAAHQGVQKGLAAQWLDCEPKQLVTALHRVDADLAEEINASSVDGGSLDRAIIGNLVRKAKGRFAELYFPILKQNAASESLDSIVATADNLWEIDQKGRASELYEIYIARAAEDQAVKAYLADPQQALRDLKPKVAVNNTLAQFWDPQHRASIADFLSHGPDFIENYYLNTEAVEKEWPEEKTDYARAYNAIQDFKAEVKRQRHRLPDVDGLLATLGDFEEIIKALALTVRVKTNLVEAYMELGDSPRAVALAQDLYKYDPLNSTYMKAVVDGVLESIAAGENISSEQLKDAQKIAATMRDNEQRSDPAAYWIASLQLLQISLALNETDLVNRILAAYGRQRRSPAAKLMRPVSDAFQLSQLGSGEGAYRVGEGEPRGRLSRGNMNIVRRFLQVYDFQGCQHSPFIDVEEVVVADEQSGGEKTVYLVTAREAGQ